MKYQRPWRLSAIRSGQTTVEFAIASLLLLTLTFGGIDVSRAVFAKHGLNRAADVIAHSLALQYSTSPTNFATSLTQSGGQQLLLNAQKISDTSFNTSGFLAPTITSTYQEWNNGSINGSTVYVCGVLDTTTPTNIDLLQVTIRAPFKPVSTFFIGGRTFQLSENVSALTFSGEDVGTDTSSNYYSNICPNHP